MGAPGFLFRGGGHTHASTRQAPTGFLFFFLGPCSVGPEKCFVRMTSIEREGAIRAVIRAAGRHWGTTNAARPIFRPESESSESPMPNHTLCSPQRPSEYGLSAASLLEEPLGSDALLPRKRALRAAEFRANQRRFGRGHAPANANRAPPGLSACPSWT